MKRWKATFQGKQTLIYADSAEECREKWSMLVDEDADITEYISTEHLEYIDKIKDKSGYVCSVLRKNGYEKREIYKCDCFCGWCYVQFTKDIRDGTYCDCVHYQVYKYGRLVELIGWYFTTPKYFYDNILNVGDMKYIEYSFRSYGKPKLSKPKELKGVKSIGCVNFNKHCNPQVFISDADVWVKHNDYFSPEWRPPDGERIDMPTSYYLKKYFNQRHTEKFIYPDCWGSIILRNEAWIKLENLVPLCKYKDMVDTQISDMIIRKQKIAVGGMSDEVCLEWGRFWENVIKLVRGEIV